jgi:hypothetical protein
MRTAAAVGFPSVRRTASSHAAAIFSGSFFSGTSSRAWASLTGVSTFVDSGAHFTLMTEGAQVGYLVGSAIDAAPDMIHGHSRGATQPAPWLVGEYSRP